MATCNKCDEEYPDARKKLGYFMCLDCGQEYANNIIQERKKNLMPAGNKLAYQPIGNGKEALKKVLGMSGKGIWEHG